MLTPFAADIILLLLLLIVLLIGLRLHFAGRDRDTLLRLETRLDEHLKPIAGLEEHLGGLRDDQAGAAANLKESLLRMLSELRTDLGTYNTRFEARHGDAIHILQQALQSGMTSMQHQVGDALTRSAEELGKRVDGLTQRTDQRLQEISGQVEKRLSEGIEKTTATFAGILKRLALIDEAQKKITELSSNVVSLQEVLATSARAAPLARCSSARWCATSCREQLPAAAHARQRQPRGLRAVSAGADRYRGDRSTPSSRWNPTSA